MYKLKLMYVCWFKCQGGLTNSLKEGILISGLINKNK